MNEHSSSGSEECRISPRFGDSEEELFRPTLRQGVDPTYAQISDKIGRLAAPVQPSFWLRSLPKNLSHKSHSLSEQEFGDSLTGSTPSTPTTATHYDRDTTHSSSSQSSSDSGSNADETQDFEANHDQSSPNSISEENIGSSNSLNAVEESENADDSQNEDNSSDDSSQIKFEWWRQARECYDRSQKYLGPSDTSVSTDDPSTSSASVHPWEKQGKHVRALVEQLRESLKNGQSTEMSLKIVKALHILLAPKGSMNKENQSRRQSQGHQQNDMVAHLAQSVNQLEKIIEAYSASQASSRNGQTDEITSSDSGKSADNSVRLQIEALNDETEELKALTQAQAMHLSSTIATLEQLDAERRDLRMEIDKSNENDRRLGEFIITLQRQLSLASEEKQGLQIFLQELNTRNTELLSEVESKEKANGELIDKVKILEARVLNSSEEDGREALALLTENKQLERDVIDMITCCKDYRRELQRITKENQRLKGCTARTRTWTRKNFMLEIKGSACDDSGCNRSGTYATRGVQVGEGNSPAALLTVERQGMSVIKDRLVQLGEERACLKDIVAALREERKLLTADIGRKDQLLNEKQTKIDHLEFLLKCEAELNRREAAKPEMALEAYNLAKKSSTKCVQSLLRENQVVNGEVQKLSQCLRQFSPIALECPMKPFEETDNTDVCSTREASNQNSLESVYSHNNNNTNTNGGHRDMESKKETDVCRRVCGQPARAFPATLGSRLSDAASCRRNAFSSEAAFEGVQTPNFGTNIGSRETSQA